MNTTSEYAEMLQFVKRSVSRFELLVVEVANYTMLELPDWYLPSLLEEGAQLGYFSIWNCSQETLS